MRSGRIIKQWLRGWQAMAINELYPLLPFSPTLFSRLLTTSPKAPLILTEPAPVGRRNSIVASGIVITRSFPEYFIEGSLSYLVYTYANQLAARKSRRI